MKKLICIVLVVFGCVALNFRGKKYIKEYPNTDPKVQHAILHHYFFRGMTIPEVQASWGDPDSRYFIDDLTEIWHYKAYTLYFKNFELDSYVSHKY